jgi:hypothetical protein
MLCFLLQGSDQTLQELLLTGNRAPWGDGRDGGKHRSDFNRTIRYGLVWSLCALHRLKRDAFNIFKEIK